MNRISARWPLLLVALSLLQSPAVASDKYVIQDDVRIDDSRLPSPEKALIYFVRTQNFGGAIAIHMGFGRARSHFEVIRPGSEAMDEFLKTKEDLRAITTTEEGLAGYETNRREVETTIAKEREDKEEIEVMKPEDGYDKPLVTR